MKWITIGKVNGNGNSSYETNYKFIDENPINGKSYYRLVQYDRNGDKTEYPVLMSHYQNEVLNVFPNPSKNYFFIPGYDPENKFQLLKATGDPVIISPDAEGKVDISYIPRGVYVLVISGNRSKKLLLIKN